MKELLQNIGKEASVNIGELKVSVKILDVKMSYGKTRFLITPLSGSGEVWIENIEL